MHLREAGEDVRTTVEQVAAIGSTGRLDQHLRSTFGQEKEWVDSRHQNQFAVRIQEQFFEEFKAGKVVFAVAEVEFKVIEDDDRAGRRYEWTCCR
jgi:hypothetical protein